MKRLHPINDGKQHGLPRLTGWLARLFCPLLVAGTLLFSPNLFLSSATAKSAGYCLECHSRNYLERMPPREEETIFKTKLSPCPGVRTVAEEMFFTESRLSRLDPMVRSLEGGGKKLISQISEASDLLSHLKDDRVTSRMAFSLAASSIRSRLQKVYDQALAGRAGADNRMLIGLGGLILLAFIFFLGIGLKKLERMKTGLLLIVVAGAALTWTSCSLQPGKNPETSAAQERLEGMIAGVAKSNEKTEAIFYRSVLLAQTAVEWSKIEPAAAAKAFESAWAMALQAGEERRGLQSLWPQDASVNRAVNPESTRDLHDEISDAEKLTWPLRAIAEEWIKIDPRMGRARLEYATGETLAMRAGENRDRQAWALSEVWTPVDVNRALEVARSIENPFLKTTALNQAADALRDREQAARVTDEGLKSAGAVASPYLRAKALAALSASASKREPSEKEHWAQKAIAAIETLKDPGLKAFALQELVSQWSQIDSVEAERWVAAISQEYPECRAYAWLSLARGAPSSAVALKRLENSLSEAAKVADPFEAEKLRAHTVKRMAAIDPGRALRTLPSLQDRFSRSEVLGQLALQLSENDKERAFELAQKIPVEESRIKTAVRISSLRLGQDLQKLSGLYAEALRSALSIPDPYTRAHLLIELGKNWGHIEQGKDALLFDLALESAGQISSPWKQAEVFEALSDLWKKSDRSKSEAVLERIDASVIRVRAALEQVRLWSRIDASKALQLSDTLSADFPWERALAFRELAAASRKRQPGPALAFFEKAFYSALISPDGPRRTRLLSEIVRETAGIDTQKTFQMLSQVQDRTNRDFFLREAGAVLMKGDLPSAMRAAREISESSLRLSLYQKLADTVAVRSRPALPEERALYHWGAGRKAAKKSEKEGAAEYAKALDYAEKMKDPRERCYVSAALVCEWAAVDDQTAFQAVKRVSSDFPEPHSYALLELASRFALWDRGQASSLFGKAFESAGRIEDPSIKVERWLQLSRRWQTLDSQKALQLFQKVEREALQFRGTPGDALLQETYLSRIALSPETALTVAKGTPAPIVRARILLQIGQNLGKKVVGEHVKFLESSLQFAAATRNFRLMGDIAVAWSPLDPAKAIEIVSQIDPKQIRVQTLRSMAAKPGSMRARLLDQAVREALEIDGANEKVVSLREIALDWTPVDPVKAKPLYEAVFRLSAKPIP